jgi:hypothetical protein
MDEEIWKTIPDYSDYQASNLGQIRSFRRNKNTPLIMKLHIDGGGYYQIDIRNDRGYKKQQSVHVLVALTFIRERKYDEVVNHIDANPLNNSIDNLEVVTKSRDALHAFRIGNRKISHDARNVDLSGEKSTNHKLTEVQVLEIRRLTTTFTYRQLAVRYNIHYTTIYDIINRRSWRHLP